MSTENLPRDAGHGAIPPLTLGLRLGIAMEHGEITRARMAAVIGVDPATITRWTHNEFKRPPMRAILERWAQLCGVSQRWLIDGEGDMPTPPAFPVLVTESKQVPSSRRTSATIGARNTPKRRSKAYCSDTSRVSRLTVADKRAA